MRDCASDDGGGRSDEGASDDGGGRSDEVSWRGRSQVNLDSNRLVGSCNTSVKTHHTQLNLCRTLAHVLTQHVASHRTLHIAAHVALHVSGACVYHAYA